MNPAYLTSAVLPACRLLVLLVLGGFLPESIRAEDLTFVCWSDQHVTTAGEARHLIPAIDAMNNLAGVEYPADVGGKAERPAFVLGCGDITEWPSAAARKAYDELITQRLKIPSFDLAGNHDEGGNSPSDTIKQWIVARHKALRYTFERGGVHFLAVYSEYNEALNNPAQDISKNALEFIRTELGKIPRGRPVVVALHLCFAAITNKEDLVKAFGDANVILVLGGHYHKPTVNEYKGFRFVQAPSPQTTTMFTVIRISSERLVAIPYDFKAGKWVDQPRLRLDTRISRGEDKERKATAP